MPINIIKSVTITIYFLIIGSILASPQIEWEKTISSTLNEYAYSVQQTRDEGFIIAGCTGPHDNEGYDAWFVKADANGIEVWNKRYGGILYDCAYSVLETYEGGYIFTGETDPNEGTLSEVFLVKTDSDGNILWNNTFGGIEMDEGKSVLQASDGGYVILGNTRSFGAGNWDIWLIKTDAEGKMLWSRTFGSSQADHGYSLRQTSDKGYIICGTSLSDINNKDLFLIKTDAGGNELWSRTFGGERIDEGSYAEETRDGGYILAGHTVIPGNLFDVLLIRTNTLGEEIWRSVFGGTGMDMVFSMEETTDGGYILAGEKADTLWSDANAYLVKCDTEGNEIWHNTFGGSSSDYFRSVQQTSDRGYVAVGGTNSYGLGDSDLYIVKLAADCVIQPVSDLTGDCKVDIKDFARMAAEWLFCGHADPNDCN